VSHKLQRILTPII